MFCERRSNDKHRLSRKAVEVASLHVYGAKMMIHIYWFLGQDVKLMSHLSPEVPENNHLLMTQLPSRCDRDLPKGDNCMVMQTYATIDELQSDDEDESRSDRQEVTGRK